jgi:hypothetical protein
MAQRDNLGNSTGDRDFTDKLTRMGDRTSLMIIDATLRSVPQDENGTAAAAGDVAALARRMLQATRDYKETLFFDSNS